MRISSNQSVRFGNSVIAGAFCAAVASSQAAEPASINPKPTNKGAKFVVHKLNSGNAL